MGWLNRNGVWFKIMGGSPSDIDAKFYRMALNDLSQLKAYTPDLEVRHFIRPGMWRIISAFGRDQIELAPEFIAGEQELKKKKKMKLPLLRYVPAFHTYDADRNWLGITLCLSGKGWGPPYFFIKCEQDRIYDFDYGQWNFPWSGNPPPENYERRSFGPIYDQNGLNLLSEIPAAHQFVGEYVSLSESTPGATIREWTSDWQIIQNRCTATQALVYGERSYEHLSTNVFHDRLILWTDDSALYEDLPYLWQADYTTAIHSNVTTHAETCWQSGGSACSNCLTTVSDAIDAIGDSLDWILNQPVYEPSQYFRIDSAIGQIGISKESFSTFDGLSAEDGCSIYVLEDHEHVTHDDYYYTTSYETHPDWEEHGGQVYANDVVIANEYISVFGNEYPLRSFNGNYQQTDAYIYWAWPRIYRTGPDAELLYTLVSLQRQPYNAPTYDDYFYEYLFFSPGAEEYQEADTFKFKLIPGGWPRLHELPITYNGQPCYGNGGFSLIEIYTPEFEEVEVEA